MTANINWLTNPTVFAVNRLDAHSDHVSYASSWEIAQGKTSLRQSLDGTWGFAWSKCPAVRPEHFWENGFDDSGFGTIQVPGHMELQGYGQIQYTNVLYPWDGHADLEQGQIDWERTYVGSYVKTFDLEPGLLGKQVCISFQGVERAFYVWLNGHFVGYSEDSFTPSDFDLTPYIQETNNRLCVEVFQHSSASWLEDQDFFRFSGIFRSVFLYAKPRLHLEDLWLQAGLCQDNTTGTLKIRLKLSGENKNCRVHCRIDGRLDCDLELHPEGTYFFSQAFSFQNVKPWCHESPTLYHVVLTLLDENGEAVEFIPYDIGFRRFEIKDRLLLLNGQRIVFNGVNRHEWNPHTGRAIGEEDMRRAMEVFLRNNINAVRTCHYPNQTPWYHMCDRNGIYMIDETNLETHGSFQRNAESNLPGNKPEWLACVLDRAKSMFERDKNHTAILLWSCGNESYAGSDILAMADFFRAQDPSRVVHYEGVTSNRAYDSISDVETQMYTRPDRIREYLESDPKKPFLLCEYMHDMGNSIGGMESYIRLGEEFPMYQGGFIWDYMDQALWHTLPDGREVLGYGGDFGDRQSDYAFSANGIVFADGTEKPAMQDVRYWYASPEARKAQDEAGRIARENMALPPYRQGSDLQISHGDGALGVRGDNFEILFSRIHGGPVSLVVNGKEWLWRAPRPAYWRSPTENDRSNGFAENSAIWSAAERWQKCQAVTVLEEGKETVSIRFTYGSPIMPDLKTEILYTVHADSHMDVEARYLGGENRPQLPLFGLRFATPEPVDTVEWTGLSGETYPDRKKGGVFGTYTEVPHIPQYLVPQECGCHMDTMQTILHSGGKRLAFRQGEAPYAFSAIPYTPWQLSEAFHPYELPAPSRTVVTICGAMRGVGGIDSWGADVEEQYHVSGEKDITLSFTVQLF